MTKKQNILVFHRSSEEVTLSKMPKYNPFGVGHGPHGDMKYSRQKNKKNFQRLLKEEKDNL